MSDTIWNSKRYIKTDSKQKDLLILTGLEQPVLTTKNEKDAIEIELQCFITALCYHVDSTPL